MLPSLDVSLAIHSRNCHCEFHRLDWLGRKYQQVLLSPATLLTSSLGVARVAGAKARMAMRTRGENILAGLKLCWMSRFVQCSRRRVE